MAKRCDATLKQLVEAHPVDWLTLAGLPAGEAVTVVEADLSTVTAAADRLLRIEGREPSLAHLEFQSGVDPEFDRRMLLYNVLARWHHGLPVRTVALLLHPRAESTGVTGGVSDTGDAIASLKFTYRIVRAWELPAPAVLEGGFGTLPLAPLCVGADELAHVFGRIVDRLSDAPPPRAQELWTASFVLSGLRHEAAVVRQVIQGVLKMRESSTYQFILQEGRVEEARKLVLKLGEKRFGPPGLTVRLLIDKIEELNKLEALIERVGEASGWDDVFVGVE